MQHIHSHNYDAFACLAGKCPASCCKGGWQIMIDDEHMELYTGDTGNDALNKRLRDGVDTVEQWFNQEDGNCMLLDDDGLCAIQRALGEEALCDTCRRYPRHMEEFRGVREWSLSLSCPEAARLIIENKDRLMFTVDETDEPEDDEAYEDFNDDFYFLLNEARDRMFDIIQSRDYSFRDKALLICAYAFGIQDCIDNENFELLQPFIECDFGLAAETAADGSVTKHFVYSIDEAALKGIADGEDSEEQEAGHAQAGYGSVSGTSTESVSLDESTANVAVQDLNKDRGFEDTAEGTNGEPAADGVNSHVETDDKAVHEPVTDGVNIIDETTELYHEPLHKNLFAVMFDLETLKGEWDDITDRTWENWDKELKLSAEDEVKAEQLLMFWVYTYFCGAVYDGWVYSKAMLAVCSTWWILQINAANDFDGGLVEAAYRYAREIEHSDDNLNALEEWFMRRI